MSPKHKVVVPVLVRSTAPAVVLEVTGLVATTVWEVSEVPGFVLALSFAEVPGFVLALIFAEVLTVGVDVAGTPFVARTSTSKQVVYSSPPEAASLLKIQYQMKE